MSFKLPSIRDMLPEYFAPDGNAESSEPLHTTLAQSDGGHNQSNANANASAYAKRRYVCQTCDKRFRRPSSLQIHLVCHTGEKSHGCTFPGCGKHFSTKSNMIRHARKHQSILTQGTAHSDGEAQVESECIVRVIPPSILSDLSQAKSMDNYDGGSIYSVATAPAKVSSTPASLFVSRTPPPLPARRAS